MLITNVCYVQNAIHHIWHLISTWDFLVSFIKWIKNNSWWISEYKIRNTLTIRSKWSTANAIKPTHKSWGNSPNKRTHIVNEIKKNNMNIDRWLQTVSVSPFVNFFYFRDIGHVSMAKAYCNQRLQQALAHASHCRVTLYGHSIIIVKKKYGKRKIIKEMKTHSLRTHIILTLWMGSCMTLFVHPNEFSSSTVDFLLLLLEWPIHVFELHLKKKKYKKK